MVEKQKILFIGDPLNSLKLSSDSSLAICESALNFNFEVFWCEKKDISYLNFEIVVDHISRITDVSSESLHYETFVPQNEKFILFSEFTHCFIRLDPPFDEAYKDLCWILNTQTKVKIHNPPCSLLNFHEKTLHLRAFSEGILEEKNLIPTCFSQSFAIAKEFLNEQSARGVQQFVSKPWLGYGGSDVMLWKNKAELLEHLSSLGRNNAKLILQPFLDEIHTVGDRRIFIVNGHVMGSFVRIPAKDHIASNLARGGSGFLIEMTFEQKKIAEKIADFLNKKSIGFAGVDMIGDKIGEINITSPTGLRAYEKLSGIKITQNVFLSQIGRPWHEIDLS